MAKKPVAEPENTGGSDFVARAGPPDHPMKGVGTKAKKGGK